MVLAEAEFDGYEFKNLMHAYAQVADPEDFYWLFDAEEKAILSRCMDPSHTKIVDLRIRPYYWLTDPRSSFWIRGVKLLKAVKGLKKKDRVRVRVDDEGSLWIGTLKMGWKAEEKDVPLDVKAVKLPPWKEAFSFKVVAKDFKRILSASAGRRASAEHWRREAYSYVAFEVHGREGKMTFFNEEASAVDLNTSQIWVLDIYGEGLTFFSLEAFNELVNSLLTDALEVKVEEKGIARIEYVGEEWTLTYYLSPSDVMEKYEKAEEKLKPKPRRLAFKMQGAEYVKELARLLKAFDAVLPVDLAILALTDSLWVYTPEEAWAGEGYVKIPKDVFYDFYPPEEGVNWDVAVSRVRDLIKDADRFEGFLEEGAALVLEATGEKIAPRSMRLEPVKDRPVAAPKVIGTALFRGPGDTLDEIVEDGVIAGERWLLFVSRLEEIAVRGKDEVWYSASLPLDGFHIWELGYMAVAEKLFNGLRGFFGALGKELVNVGYVKDPWMPWLQAKTDLGEVKAHITYQKREDVEEALRAYEEEYVKPPPPVEAPIVPAPIPTPPPIPPPIPPIPPKPEPIRLVEDAIREVEAL
jgi:hypothetical protein